MPTTPRQWIHSYVRLPLVGTKVTVRAPAHLRTYTSRSPSYGLLHRRLLPRWVSWDSEQHQEVPVHIGSACLYGSGMHALQLLRRLPTAQREHGYPRGQVYNQPGSTNVLVPLSSFRRGELWLLEEHGPDLSPKGQHQGGNHPLRLPGLEYWSSTPSPSTRHARGRTTDWSCQRTLLFEQTDSNSPTSITL